MLAQMKSDEVVLLGRFMLRCYTPSGIIAEFRPEFRIAGITDSKLIPPDVRIKIAEEIKVKALCWAVAWRRRRNWIDQYSSAASSPWDGVKALKHCPEMVLIDGNQRIGGKWRQETYIQGDLRCHPIGAASILAKVARDSLMSQLDEEHPGYGFRNHKGYGTQNIEKPLQNSAHPSSPATLCRGCRILFRHNSLSFNSGVKLKIPLSRLSYRWIYNSPSELENPYSEIDVVAEKDRELWIFEVKKKKDETVSTRPLVELQSTSEIAKCLALDLAKKPKKISHNSMPTCCRDRKRHKMDQLPLLYDGC